MWTHCSRRAQASSGEQGLYRSAGLAAAAEVEMPSEVAFAAGRGLKRLLVLDGLQDPGNVVRQPQSLRLPLPSKAAAAADVVATTKRQTPAMAEADAVNWQPLQQLDP